MSGTLRVSLLCLIVLFGVSAQGLDFDKEIAKQERTTAEVVEVAKTKKQRLRMKRKTKSQKVAGYHVRLIKRSQLGN